MISAVTVTIAPVYALGDDVLAGFEQCSELGSDAEQLQCFRDALDSARSQSRQPPTTDAVEGDESGDARVDSRGASTLPTRGCESAADRALASTGGGTCPAVEQGQAVFATVSSARRTAFGKLILNLDNGETWLETDGSYYRGEVRPGDTVSISKRRFGGYKMQVDDQPGAILVRRSR